MCAAFPVERLDAAWQRTLHRGPSTPPRSYLPLRKLRVRVPRSRSERQVINVQQSAVSPSALKLSFYREGRRERKGKKSGKATADDVDKDERGWRNRN